MENKEIKKVAILQSNYIPWKGYFDIIDQVDDFIFFDNMQYTKNDWRNRNKIKTKRGALWLTIPCETKGHIIEGRKISETKITDKRWAKKHWKSICNAYAKAPYFKDYKAYFEKLYKECESEDYLCQVNYKFIIAILKLLNIKTKLHYDRDYELIDGKTERLIDVLQKVGATHYLSGPSAKDYIDEKLFEKAGIELLWMDYSGYKEYPQLFPPFEHNVSILDLIFNTGEDAIKYIREKDNV